MKVGDSYLVSSRRIDQIQKIIPGSDRVTINVYTSFGSFPFSFENREGSLQSIYDGLSPITDLEAESISYIPEENPSSDLYDEYLSKTTPSKPAMPEFTKMMTETFVKPEESSNAPAMLAFFGVGIFVLFMI